MSRFVQRRSTCALGPKGSVQAIRDRAGITPQLASPGGAPAASLGPFLFNLYFVIKQLH